MLASHQGPTHRALPSAGRWGRESAAREGEVGSHGRWGLTGVSKERLGPENKPFNSQIFALAFLCSHRIHSILAQGREPPPPRASASIFGPSFPHWQYLVRAEPLLLPIAEHVIQFGIASYWLTSLIYMPCLTSKETSVFSPWNFYFKVLMGKQGLDQNPQ